METPLLTEQFARTLAAVDAAAAEAYALHAPLLIDYVNRMMRQHPLIGEMLGPNALEVMYDNHTNHAEFMLTQFRLKSAGTLHETLIWVFHSYVKRGFAADYFPTALNAWMDAVRQHLDAHSAGVIGPVYQLMLDVYPDMFQLAQSTQPCCQTDAAFEEPFQRYLRALLVPDITRAVQIAEEFIQSVWDIPVWYEQIILPSMYEIGRLWSEGEIAVGQEHIATAITQRIMSMYYPMILELPRNRGTVLVTASPDELHEIGARMVADMLEMHGWDVYYTGADTPEASLLELLQQHPVRFICISTTLASSLRRTGALIAAIRAAKLDPAVHIIVGGQAYLHEPNLWKWIGADGFAGSATDLVRYLQDYHQ